MERKRYWRGYKKSWSNFRWNYRRDSSRSGSDRSKVNVSAIKRWKKTIWFVRNKSRQKWLMLSQKWPTNDSRQFSQFMLLLHNKCAKYENVRHWCWRWTMRPWGILFHSCWSQHSVSHLWSYYWGFFRQLAWLSWRRWEACSTLRSQRAVNAALHGSSVPLGTSALCCDETEQILSPEIRSLTKSGTLRL